MDFGVIYGTLAAVFSPLLLATGFTIWDRYSPFHPYMLNTVKCALSSILFGITVWVIIGTSSSQEEVQQNITIANSTVDYDETSKNLLNFSMLIVSGIIGIVLGDNAWLHALHLIGARRVILVDSIKPFAAALAAWPTLGEPVKPIAFLGMAITMSSIVVVSLENDKTQRQAEADEVNNARESKPQKASSVVDSDEANSSRQDTNIGENSVVVDGDIEGQLEAIERASSRFSINQIGYMWSALNVVLDVFGSILTKRFGTAFNSFEIGGIRFGSSAIILLFGIFFFRSYRRCRLHVGEPWVLFSESSEKKKWWQLVFNNRFSITLVLLGVFVTTFLGPTLQNYAIFKLPISTFSTLQALTPIWSIPVVYLLKQEKTSRKALLGSVCAVLGVIPLYLA